MSKKSKDKPLTRADATWWDHHQLNFWLWGCLRSAETYLAASNTSEFTFMEMYSGAKHGPEAWVTSVKTHKGEHERSRHEGELAKYHFVATMGVMIRVLKRAQHLFPAIQPAYNRATHLLTEGQLTRDMIEHAPDGYSLGQGKHQDRFIRDSNPKGHWQADATSTMVIDGRHLVGGRLCVEKVVEEVNAIYAEAQKLRAPDKD